MTQPTVDLATWRLDPTDPRLDDSRFDAERLDQLEPKRWLVGGKRVPFYTVGQLAWMLGRSPVTIRDWERQGLLPTTPYLRHGANLRGSRRLYTREQVLGIVQIAREEGVLRMYEVTISRTNFTAKVTALFTGLKAA